MDRGVSFVARCSIVLMVRQSIALSSDGWMDIARKAGVMTDRLTDC